MLGVLGSGRVDLHFVKCLLPNREAKTRQEEGCFDWQAVLSSCMGHGIFEIAQLQLVQNLRNISKKKRFSRVERVGIIFKDLECLLDNTGSHTARLEA